MRVSQQDIANHLDLSVATISKSLRNSTEIHPHTRAKVIALASKMGYRASTSRIDKSRSRKEVRTICLLLQSDMTLQSNDLPHANLVLAGLSEAAQAEDVSVVVHYVPLRDRERVMDPACQPVMLRQGMLSGMVIQHYFPAHVVKELATIVPCVSITRHSPDLQLDHVDLDSGYTMGIVVNHLRQLGHRRIGFLGALSGQAPLAAQVWHQERFGAYVQSLISAGLEYDHALAHPHRHAAISDDQAVQQVVEQTHRGVTAWVTASDAIASVWCAKLLSRGLSIPTDVSITGIDAVNSQDNSPRLTSVRVPFEAMGRAALSLLMQRINEPSAPTQRVSFAGTLVKGDTTGQAPTACMSVSE